MPDALQGPHAMLNDIKCKNMDRLIIAHLNINSIRNKFEALKQLVNGKIDILVITESKIDSSFPLQQFRIEGYSQYRVDRNSEGGGVVVYIREDLPSRKLNIPCDEIEGIFIEINIKNNKWLLFGGYNPEKSKIGIFLEQLQMKIDQYMKNYENFLILGDFNSEITEEKIKSFCEMYGLKNIVKGPTCYKNPNKPTSIDLILTNKIHIFQNNINIETGLSDHHLMTVCVMKYTFPKRAPLLITYRSYKKYNNESFRNELENRLCFLNSNATYENFESIFLDIINKHAPMKKKFLRANNSPFMNKILSKAFMQRSKLKNKFNKFPSKINEENYKRQRNYCVNLLRREKKKYYNNLNINTITDNKTFWKTIKPLFSEKNNPGGKITLIESGTIISEDIKVANTFNDYFTNVVKTLNIQESITEDEVEDNIEDCISRYENHESIIRIKQNINIDNNFQFSASNLENMENKINDLNIHKPTTINHIPAKILASVKDISSNYIHYFYNKSIKEGIFPNSLKLADITPAHKKGDKSDKENYRPISILPTPSKIFEKIIYEDIYNYMNDKLSPCLCGFRKGYSSQYCLILMLERWKEALDNKNLAGAILTDLSKAFDCLNHNLLIAKLEAYGFSRLSLALISSYLTGRKQRTKINNSLSEWSDISSGIPQGSILGPLLFNIYINDIFYFVKEDKITNYADDTTPYAIENNINKLICTLEIDINTILTWFDNNFFKLNPDKCKLLITKHAENVEIKIKNVNIVAEKSVKLLGIKIDNNLNFNEHVSSLCKKANLKLHALSRVSHIMNKDKLRLLLKAFIETQFAYCPLIWMFHSRMINNKINRLHERALRLVYKDSRLTFEELLRKDNSFSIHHRNLQKLTVEMYKAHNDISPSLMKSVFPQRDIRYDLRNKNTFYSRNVHTVLNGTETISFRGPQIWALVPENIKSSTTLNEFKAKIKNWEPAGCTCRLCRNFILNLGFT